MGKKDKKKGKGAEKTAAKTEKKLSNKMKKELALIGEDDIEKIVAEIEEEERKRLAVTEKVVQPPKNRVNFSLTAHPDKDELIMFGGEFYNGQKTIVYNDLYFYHISRDEWTQVKAPKGPPPRCSHQTVAVSTEKGQLWMFGGEFISPSQTQFYHYKDLWVYHLAQKHWEKVNADGGPSSRSGHRMVCAKKQLIVFGGFHENNNDYKYFNDLYAFSLEDRTWKKLTPTGTAPSPRSGFQMFSLAADGKILVYGGYSKVKVKKDVDKGIVHTDMFLLSPDKGDTTGLKWKWSCLKPGGVKPSARSGISAAMAPPNRIFAFGGVMDQEDEEEDLVSEFFNELLLFEVDRTAWRNVSLSGKKQEKKRKKKDKDAMDENCDDEDEVMEEETDTSSDVKTPVVVADDGIFTVTVGPTPTTSETKVGEKDDSGAVSRSSYFVPSPRINCGMAVKHGILYLFGGMFEQEEKQLTFSDFYSLDLRKLDEWRTIIPPSKEFEWLGSDESESDDDEDDDSEEDEEEEGECENGTDENMDIS